MYIKQIYTGCLSEAAYFFESKGEDAIINTMRDIDSHYKSSKKDKDSLKYIFQTHILINFVSDHLDLNKKPGAQILFIEIEGR